MYPLRNPRPLGRGGFQRVVRRHDGYYVVGHGMLMYVDTPEEGATFIREEKNKG